MPLANALLDTLTTGVINAKLHNPNTQKKISLNISFLHYVRTYIRNTYVIRNHQNKCSHVNSTYLHAMTYIIRTFMYVNIPRCHQPNTRMGKKQEVVRRQSLQHT
jgi:hypothetical protein